MRTYKEFVERLNTEIYPQVKKLRLLYLKDINNFNRVWYQTAKFTEEVSEFSVALIENKSCGGKYKYPDIRGTYESEAADVILSGILLCVVMGIQVNERYTSEIEDIAVATSSMLQWASLAEVSKVFNRTYNILHDRNIDLFEHVRGRLCFNKKLLSEEKKVLNA